MDEVEGRSGLERKGVLAAAAGAVLWGTMGPAVDAWQSLSPSSTAFARSFVAAFTLAALAWRATTAWTIVGQQSRWLLGGGIGLAGFQFCYFKAVSVVGVSISTAISIGLAPLFTGVAVWLTAARPSALWLVGTVSSIIGLALMLLGPADQSGRWLTGSAWAVAAGGLFSLQIIAIARTTRTRWPSAAALAWMFVVAALILAPVGLPELAERWPAGPSDVTRVLYLGAVTAAVAYWLFAAGAKAIGASTAATISLLEPATAVLLAVVFLGERQSGVQWCGMVLLLCSVVATACAPSDGPTGPPRARTASEPEKIPI